MKQTIQTRDSYGKKVFIPNVDVTIKNKKKLIDINNLIEKCIDYHLNEIKTLTRQVK